MSDTLDQLAQKANETFGKLEALVPEMEAAIGQEGDRYQSLKTEVDKLADETAEVVSEHQKAKQEQELQALKAKVADLAKDVRTPSKAAAILGEMQQTTAPADYFFVNLAVAQNPKAPTEVRQAAHKALLDMGSHWTDVPSYSKATLGDTDAAGGYIVPNNIVAELSRVATANNPYRQLLTVVTGVRGSAVDVPHQGLGPTRATVVARGVTKDNANLSLASYTATFYTLAKIYDVSNQLLRQSAGAAERMVRQDLAESIAQGESYYILNGSGTNEPKGLLTSIGTSGTFVTSHTAAQTTIAGNIASGLAKAAGDLANRNRRPTGAVMNAGDFFITMASGADAAGFYIAPGGPTTVNLMGGFSNVAAAVSIWGIPLLADPNMPADSLVVGEWKAAQLFIGEDYRVDTSNEAGDRWDKNLTGFRGEEEIAFNADPYVSAGLFQRLIDTKA